MKALVVNFSTSSNEENLITDVSWDEDFARRLFGDLNRDILVPHGDDKIIILTNSDEEEEVCEEKAVTTEAAPSSAARSPAPTASIDDADGTYKSNTPDRATCGCSSGRDEASLP
jgi:hypothetical protein